MRWNQFVHYFILMRTIDSSVKIGPEWICCISNPMLIHFSYFSSFCLGFGSGYEVNPLLWVVVGSRTRLKTLPRGVTASLIPTPHNVFPGGLSMFLDAMNGCLGGLETPHRRHLEGLWYVSMPKQPVFLFLTSIIQTLPVLDLRLLSQPPVGVERRSRVQL